MLSLQNQRLLNEALKDLDLGFVKVLLDAGADPNWYREGVVERPPMNEAAAGNFIAGLHVLHEAGGYIQDTEISPITPLISAIDNGHIEVVKWLLRHGAEILDRGPGQENAMHHALLGGHVEMADTMLQERPEIRGNVLNSIAVRVIESTRNAETAQWLLNAGITPNLTGSKGDSWLMLAQSATERFTGPLSELLLAAGADPNFQGGKGRTALHRVVSLQSLRGFTRLLRAGADPDLADDQGDTVRGLLQQRADLRDMHEALVAWEASAAAHRALVIPSSNPSPL